MGIDAIDIGRATFSAGAFGRDAHDSSTTQTEGTYASCRCGLVAGNIAVTLDIKRSSAGF